jgi:hypothetical protein
MTATVSSEGARAALLVTAAYVKANLVCMALGGGSATRWLCRPPNRPLVANVVVYMGSAANICYFLSASIPSYVWRHYVHQECL